MKLIQKSIFLLIFCVAMMSTTAHAADHKLYFEFFGNIANVTIEHFPGTGAKPTLTQGDIGLTLAYRLSRGIAFGITSDFRQVGQWSDVDPQTGNFRGTRFNTASPTLLFTFSRVIFKFEYELMGDYILTNSTVQGGTISYRSPTGERISLIYMIKEHVGLGLEYEAISYSSFNDSIQGNTTLNPKFKMNSMGLSLSLIF